MSIISSISAMARRHHQRRLRIRTYLSISALPRSVQKDIGWPDGDGFDDSTRGHGSAVTERSQLGC